MNVHMLKTTTFLSNPPIQEAILDFRFSSKDGNLLSKIQKYAEGATSRYPDKKDSVELKVEIPNTENQDEVKRERRIVGCLLKSENGSRLVQAASESFSCHVLPPYTKWDELLGMMRYEWAEFSKYLDNTRISRVGVRYINNIEFEFVPGKPIGDYIRMVPTLPNTIPQVLDNFFVQITVPFENNIKAGITLTLNEIKDNQVSMIFDVDVFTIDNLLISDSLDSTLNTMRTIKNDIFFGTLSELALKNYL